MGTIVVSGGAGFIASHLEEKLLSEGHKVVSIDIIDRENCSNIDPLFDNHNFSYYKQDVNDTKKMLNLTKNCDFIYHLAANADVRRGGENPNIDYRQTLSTTFSILECMRINHIPDLFFASSSAVYGKKEGPLKENSGELEPESYYGASKLASEALISAYSHMNDFNALVFRFPNVVGPRLTHGIIYDFINKLSKNSRQLEILGNGKQRKQYVYIEDLIAGILSFTAKMDQGYSLYNVSTESFTDVNTIASLVCKKMDLDDVEYVYTGGECGWKGDVPFFDFDVSKAKSKGWTYKYNSTESIEKTLDQI